jgi:hypothetical protein
MTIGQSCRVRIAYLIGIQRYAMRTLLGSVQRVLTAPERPERVGHPFRNVTVFEAQPLNLRVVRFGET